MKINIIGIGAGNPAHLTLEAISAIREVDVFIVPDKGGSKSDLVGARRAIVEAHHDGDYEVFTIEDPKRGPDAQRTNSEYTNAVLDWHQARAHAYVAALRDLPPGTVVGFLTWGDPAFYDSTIRIVEHMSALMDATWQVIPGISAFQALAAAHKIVLHDVGAPVHVTTGRRLPHEWRDDLGTVVVMLDGHLSVQALVDQAPNAMIYWGAYLGLPNQTIRAGRLSEIIGDLAMVRASLRAEHGWIMDVYAIIPEPA